MNIVSVLPSVTRRPGAIGSRVYRIQHTICPSMGLDNIDLGIKSYCCSESREDNTQYTYSLNDIGNRVRIHEIGNDPGWGWDSSDHSSLEGGICPAPDFC